MNRTVGSQPMRFDKQGMNMTIGTIARINPIDEQAICLMVYIKSVHEL